MRSFSYLHNIACGPGLLTWICLAIGEARGSFCVSVNLSHGPTFYCVGQFFSIVLDYLSALYTLDFVFPHAEASKRCDNVADLRSSGHIFAYDHDHLCLGLNLLSLLVTSNNMAEPTKAETEQVFKVLKAQKANKVRPPLSLASSTH